MFIEKTQMPKMLAEISKIGKLDDTQEVFSHKEKAN